MTSAVLHLLETFPGWPEAPDPNPFTLFMLCLGAPILVGIVVCAIGMGTGGRKELAETERELGLSLDSVDPAPIAPLRRGLPADAEAVEAH